MPKRQSGLVRWIRRWRCSSEASRLLTIRPDDMRKLSDTLRNSCALRPGFQGAQRMRCASLAQVGASR